MKNKKVILAGALICAAGLCTAGLAVPSSPLNLASIIQADDAVYEGFLYKIQDGKAIITGYSADLDLSDVKIPDAIVDGENSYPVTIIGEKAFYKSKAVKITVSDSVEQIGAYAFAQCTDLKELDLGKNTRIIGDGAIGSYRERNSEYSTSYQINLDKLIIPDNASSIGTEIFSEYASGGVYTNYKELVIRDSVTNINSVFYNKWYVNNFTVDENNAIYSSEYGILFNKDKTELIRCPISTTLESYDLPDSVITVMDNAFYNCRSLKSINVNDAAETIGDFAFARCLALKELNLGKNVTTVGKSIIGSYRERNSEYSTSYQIFLDKLVLPDNLTSIGSSIFSSNPDGGIYTSVKELVIPASVIFIDSQFYHKNTLQNITVSEDNQTFSSDNGILYNKDKTELIRCPQSTQLLEYNVAETVNLIDNSAFYWCSNLKIITVNDAAETIGDYAFARCTALKELTLGRNVIAIGKSAIGSYRERNSEYATSYQINLSKLTIPDNLLSIGDDLFSSNPDGGIYTTFKELIVRDSVTDISSTFYHEDTLSNITVDENNKVYSSDNGVLLNKDQTELIRCPQATTLQKYNVPETVKKVTGYSFYWCTSLKTINVNDNAESIGKCAFARCTSLKELYLGKNVTTLGDYAIGSYRSRNSQYDTAYQISIDKLTLPDNMTTIGESILSENTSGGVYSTIKELIIPDSCSNIPSWLYNHSSLNNITVGSENTTYLSDRGILYTGDKKELIKCPNSSSLIKYEILDGTEKIYASAFANSKVMAITIPASVSSIGEKAFSGSDLKIINGYEGSYAETYAADNNFKFVSIGQAAVTTPAVSETEPVSETTSADPAVTEPAESQGTDTSEPAVTTAPVSSEEAPESSASETPAETEPAVTTVVTPSVTEPVVTTIMTPTVTEPVDTTLMTPSVTEPVDTTTVEMTTTAAHAPVSSETETSSASAVPAVTTVADTTAVPVTTTAAAAEKPSKGDVDGDGEITTTDVKNILKHIVGRIKFTEAQASEADINGDGSVNTSDALLLLRAIAGMTE